MSKNPFNPAFVRMKLPADAGPSISIGGFNLVADSDRCVDIPPEKVEELKAHGLTIAPAKGTEEAEEPKRSEHPKDRR